MVVETVVPSDAVRSRFRHLKMTRRTSPSLEHISPHPNATMPPKFLESIPQTFRPFTRKPIPRETYPQHHPSINVQRPQHRSLSFRSLQRRAARPLTSLNRHPFPPFPKHQPQHRTLTTTHPLRAPEPAPISLSEYHDRSDSYIETLLQQLEELQEDREDVDVEFSVCPTPPPIASVWISSLPSFSYFSLISPPPPLHHPTSADPHVHMLKDVMLYPGRSTDPQIPTARHIRPQQATSQQADMAQ